MSESLVIDLGGKDENHLSVALYKVLKKALHLMETDVPMRHMDK